MRFVTLFGLRVKHDYYADAVCRDLSVEPTENTRRLLDRYRLRLRELEDGIVVSADADAGAKTARIPIARDELFVFQLRVHNPDFALFTDLRELAGKADPLYTNAALVAADHGTLKLGDRKSWRSETFAVPAGTAKLKFTLAGDPLDTEGDALKAPQAADFSIVPPAAGKVTAYDAASKIITVQPSAANKAGEISVRYRAKPAADRNALAGVELRYDKSMPELGANDTAFEIRFKARAARWAYYLVTDRTGEFSIVDSSSAAPALGFSAANRTLLNQVPGEPDPLAAALSRQYPELQRLRFLSDQPVPCSSAVRKGIELRLGGEKVLGAIPNPSVRQVSRIKQKLGAALQDQDTFHQVVKYLKAH
jgi:hypothetical protein